MWSLDIFIILWNLKMNCEKSVSTEKSLIYASMINRTHLNEASHELTKRLNCNEGNESQEKKPKTCHNYINELSS